MGFVGRKPTNAPLTSDDIPNGIIGAEDLAAGLSKITFDTTPKTTGFTAVANTGYFCNTTSAGFTVTLPATPSAGDQVQLVDYAGTFDTNNLTIDPNGEDIIGQASNILVIKDREAITLTYIDSTQGWLSTSGINEGTDAITSIPINIEYLVVAGGGSGGAANAGGGGAGGLLTNFGGSAITFDIGTTYTVTVGAGGASVANPPAGIGNSGSNSELSGTGIATITAIGGGYGGRNSQGGSGGSGGGNAYNVTSSGGSGTVGQGNDGGSGSSGGPELGAGGGGGAGAVGGNGTTTAGGAGGVGLSNSITGSATFYAGGGGGSVEVTAASAGAGGNGGGGAGSANTNATSGTSNTGGGGGGVNNATSGAGGSGVVILRLPTAQYSGTTTGSPTVTTDGTDTIIKFTASGSYTA